MYWDDPFREMRRMQEEMNRRFNEMQSGFRGTAMREPVTRVTQTAKEVIVTIELPGVGKPSIRVNATPYALNIQIQGKIEKKTEREGFASVSSSFSSFYRTIPLPAEVLPETANAKYEDGLLVVRIAKKSVPKSAKKLKEKGVEVKIQ